jgi:hypothetical protein
VFILDVPPDSEESIHVNRAFKHALQLAGKLPTK